MSLFYRARMFANQQLAHFGLAISRTQKTRWGWGNPIITTQVGRYAIQVPSINPISTHYTLHPNYSGHLGRLALLLKKKFPQFSALDIGANVGDTACIIKSAADVPLLCIEGDDYTYGFLKQNLQQFQNATAHNLFLGEQTGTMDICVEKSGWNTTLVPSQTGKTGASKKLKIISLDDFLATQPNTSLIKLLKIDTEGFDCAILRGAKNFIKRVQPVITFEYNRENMDAIGEPGLDTIFMLADMGYSRIVFHDAFGRLLCSTTLAERDLIKDLHSYSDGKRSSIYYYDVTVFPTSDADIATAFIHTERSINEDKAHTY
ncbi:MAG TPA: FkbM family methyltransferase [Verrucomicrobiae bacterium]|jgi:FkbM family methyltransferase